MKQMGNCSDGLPPAQQHSRARALEAVPWDVAWRGPAPAPGQLRGTRSGNEDTLLREKCMA